MFLWVSVCVCVKTNSCQRTSSVPLPLTPAQSSAKPSYVCGLYGRLLPSPLSVSLLKTLIPKKALPRSSTSRCQMSGVDDGHSRLLGWPSRRHRQRPSSTNIPCDIDLFYLISSPSFFNLNSTIWLILLHFFLCLEMKVAPCFHYVYYISPFWNTKQL